MAKMTIKVKEATEPKTRVWFGIEQDEDGEFQETLAVFVDDIHNGRVSVYSPVGQHSEADIDYVRGLYACTHPKSDALYNELKGLGYDLEVINTNAAEQVLGTMFPDGNQREDEDPSEFDVYESKKGESKFKCSMAKKKESLGKKNEEAVPFNATEFPKELKQMYNACSKEFYCESELSSAVDVSSGKDGVSSAHYVLRGEYGSYAKLKVVFDYDKEDGFTITILGLDETVGYDWVELGSGKSSSFKEALTTALNEFGKNIMSLVSKIRKATGKSESKKNESVYGTVRVDSEDIAIKVQESNVYPSSSGRSLSGDVPKVESWFSTLSEFSDCIDGMAEDCNGYPDISRDGSDILVKINAPMEDENGEFNGDYEVIVELRCSTEITNGSLDGVVDLLNHE